jgi:predicted aspartyl protease
MTFRGWVVWSALAAVALSRPGPALAEIYRWTDEAGAIHYAQGLDSVPERHRSRAHPVRGGAIPAVVSATRAPSAEAPATARVPFTPGRPIMVSARINGAGAAELLLDTGASVTVVNPRVLAALGVSMRGAHRASLQGVTGKAEVLTVRVESIEVGGATVGPLHVVSHDTGIGEGDGLLGRDFLDRFTVSIDNRAGLLTLTPR